MRKEMAFNWLHIRNSLYVRRMSLSMLELESAFVSAAFLDCIKINYLELRVNGKYSINFKIEIVSTNKDSWRCARVCVCVFALCMLWMNALYSSSIWNMRNFKDFHWKQTKAQIIQFQNFNTSSSQSISLKIVIHLKY